MSYPETTRASFQDNFKAVPTDETLDVLEASGKEAMAFRHQYIGTEHILLAIIQQPQMHNTLEKLEITPKITIEKARSMLNWIIGHGDKTTDSNTIILTPRARRVIVLGVDEASKEQRSKDITLEPEHILLGMLKEGFGLAAGVLEGFGFNLPNLYTNALRLRGDRLREQHLEDQSEIQSDQILSETSD